MSRYANALHCVYECEEGKDLIPCQWFENLPVDQLFQKIDNLFKCGITLFTKKIGYQSDLDSECQFKFFKADFPSGWHWEISPYSGNEAYLIDEKGMRRAPFYCILSDMPALCKWNSHAYQEIGVWTSRYRLDIQGEDCPYFVVYDRANAEHIPMDVDAISPIHWKTKSNKWKKYRKECKEKMNLMFPNDENFYYF